MDKRRMRSLTRLEPSEIALTHRLAPGRTCVEKFIEGVYARDFGSNVTARYPTLLSVRDGNGSVVAAVGLRFAADEPLFLERYLPAPVESVVSETVGVDAGRDEIVEIGSLASAARGASVFLFVTLAAYLRQRKMSYAAATATKSLRRSFAMFGIDVTELGQARAEALPDKGAAWGSYYTRDPKVLVGAIQPAFAQLEPYLPLVRNGDLERVFTRPFLSVKDFPYELDLRNDPKPCAVLS